MVKGAQHSKITIDTELCQAEYREGSFMTLGPRAYKRCKNPAILIAVENEPSEKDGRRGGMSLCLDCAKVMEKRNGKDYATLFIIA